MTFGFIVRCRRRSLRRDGETIVPIANPLSESFAVLRPSVLPGLVDLRSRTIAAASSATCSLFEIGTRFTKQTGETQALAFVVDGRRPAAALERADARRGLLRRRRARVGESRTALDATVLFKPLTAHQRFWWRGRPRVWRSAKDRCLVGTASAWSGRSIAEVGELLGLPAEVPRYVAEIGSRTARPLQATTLQALAPPRFPSVDRDISILVDDTTPAQIRPRNGPQACDSTPRGSARVRSLPGKGIPDGKVSLSLRLTFRSGDRTLTDAEVQKAMDDVLAALKQRHGAVQR